MIINLNFKLLLKLIFVSFIKLSTFSCISNRYTLIIKFKILLQLAEVGEQVTSGFDNIGGICAKMFLYLLTALKIIINTPHIETKGITNSV